MHIKVYCFLLCLALYSVTVVWDDQKFNRKNYTYTAYSQIYSAPFLQFQRAKKSDAD